MLGTFRMVMVTVILVKDDTHWGDMIITPGSRLRRSLKTISKQYTGGYAPVHIHEMPGIHLLFPPESSGNSLRIWRVPGCAFR